ncbi:uncharacterized protein B0T23DRAFT_433279 [Neurospora hispaniola]|uniref:Uncharacterized protein n=1 Tax=Neurospora hispaniola TaxID=588809 RepID=A0AAJ0HYI9_9PEZI|nr:hypothetical protein B0T23DRAFT_433279 [Neurospora hispaniola]
MSSTLTCHTTCSSLECLKALLWAPLAADQDFGRDDTSDYSDSERSRPIQGDTQSTQYQVSEVFLGAVDGRVREPNEQKNTPRWLDGAAVGFEVRAKADRCITNDDSNDEGSKQRRPPWKTHGMASWGLRLFKNNTTGEARLQLCTES